MENPLISVIMPAYNASKHIIETLNSIKIQTYTNWEIIVANDCSADNTVDLINQFAKQVDNPVKIITNKINAGVSGSRNIAVANASGIWLALLDSDDVWLPNHLETLMMQVKSDSEVKVVFSGFQAFLDNVNTIIFNQEINKDMLNDLYLSLYTHQIGITSSTALIEKKSWNSIGGMIQGLNYCEEMELFIRLAKQGAKFKFSEYHTTLYRKHSNATSASDNPVKMASGTLYIYENHFDWEVVPLKIRSNLLFSAHIVYARLIRRQNSIMAAKHVLKALKIKLGLRK
jgi:teichuronic acid biosynthesis glycosyltransferase TuaG